jgi:streptogramin lyase
MAASIVRQLRAIFLGTLTFALLVTSAVLARPAAAATITEFPIPIGTLSSRGSALNLGPDGRVWFAQQFDGMIGAISPAGDIAQFRAPPRVFPNGVAAGPDGRVWVSAQYITPFAEGAIGAFSLTNHSWTIYPLRFIALAITAGPDGNLWFLSQDSDTAYRITTAGAITPFPLPTFSQWGYITVGGDGNLWIAQNSDIVKLSTTGAAVSYPAAGQPEGIAWGSDGNVWFAEYVGNRIGRLDPASGAITEFPVAPAGAPIGIGVGYGNDLWFGEQGRVGHIIVDGTVGEFPFPGRSPNNFVRAAGSIWFGDHDRIGRITLQP